MLSLVRSSLHDQRDNLVRLGCALASVLALTLSGACVRTCPKGYFERDGQCFKGSDAVDTDASAQQENAAEKTPGDDGGTRKPDASAAGKPTMSKKADASTGQAAGGSGGASGESATPGLPAAAAHGGSGGEPAAMPMQTPEMMKPRNCLVGATRCSETEVGVEVCTVDDAWMKKESCLATCHDGACSGDCRPGERHCGANQTTEICSDMGAWTPAETCPFVCMDGNCGGDCAPGSLQCGGSDGLTVQTCDESGRWVDTRHCDNICSSGSCSGTCMPRTKRCRTSTIPEQCSDDGYWEAKLPCPFVCGPDGECAGVCRPGTKRCDDQTPSHCDETGQWVQDSACTSVGKACINGVCGGACSPSSPLRCGPDQTSQQCSDSGRWEVVKNCPFVCTGAGVCGGVCSPDSKMCSGDTLRTCRGDGLAYNDNPCQPAQTNEVASCNPKTNACESMCPSENRCTGSSLCWRLQYGCEQCISPYVWREATGPDDKVCVPPEARTRSANENSMYPVGDPCPDTLVARLATPGDHRCVPPENRAKVVEENTAARGRTQVGTGRQP